MKPSIDDGTTKFVSVVPGDPIKVVKTIFPPDMTVEIGVGETKERK